MGTGLPWCGFEEMVRVLGGRTSPDHLGVNLLSPSSLPCSLGLALPASSQGQATSSEEGNGDRCSLKVLSSHPDCLALLVVALAMRSHARFSSLQSEFGECNAELALLCGVWKHKSFLAVAFTASC